MRVGLVSLVVAGILILLIGISQAFGVEKPVEPEPAPETEQKKDEGVLRTIRTVTHILKEGLPKFRIFPWKRHPLLKNTKEMYTTSKAIYGAAKMKGTPTPILIVMGFREGSFRPGSKGKIGEESMFQMVPSTAKLVKKIEPLCDLSTVEGSAICASTWLRHWKDECGDWKGSIAKYATGKTCEPVNDRVKWLVKDRLGIAKTLNDKFWKKEKPTSDPALISKAL
jgi:hypothetical protein